MATQAGRQEGRQTRRLLRNHPYITSAKDMDGWVQKITNFSDVPYSIYTDIVSTVDGWVRKITEMADVVYEWSLGNKLIYSSMS